MNNAITLKGMLDYFVTISRDFVAIKQDERELTYGEFDEKACELAKVLCSGIMALSTGRPL